MPIAPDELSRRLEKADQARAVLRRATLEWQALGRELLKARNRGPRRPDDGNARGR